MPSVLGGAGGAAKPKIRPKPKGKGAPSLLGQIGSIVGGAPRGIASLAGAAAKDVYRASPADDVIASVSKGDAGELLTADWFLPGAETYQRAYTKGRKAVKEGKGFEGALTALADESPLGGMMTQSIAHTGQRLGQTAIAAAPGGQAFGENPYSRASREGNIVGTLLEDVGNYALLAGPVVKGFGGAAGAATKGAELAAVETTAARGAASTAARTVASTEGVVNPAGAQAVRAVQSAAREAAQARRASLTAGATGIDPAAAAAVARADAQLAAARAAPILEPVQALRATAAEAGVAQTGAEAAAAQAWKRFDAANKIVHLGNRAAGSPFIPFTMGAKTVGNVLRPLGRAAGETRLGQAALTRGAGLVENAQARLGTFEQNRADIATVAPELEAGAGESARFHQATGGGGGLINELVAEPTQKRSLLHPLGGKTIKQRDPVAESAIWILGTGEAEHLATMAKAGIPRAEAVAEYARAQQQLAESGRGGSFEPPVDTIALAYDVLDPATDNPAAQRIQANQPEILEVWRDDVAGPQRAQYLAGEGEAAGVMDRPYERAQRAFNVRGTGPQTAHLKEYNLRRLKLEARKERKVAQAERERVELGKRVGRVEGMGVREAERGAPEQLLGRLQDPAIRAGRAIVERPGVLEQLAETPEFGPLARRILSGRVAAAEAPGLLANRMIEMLNRKRKSLSPTTASLLELFDSDVPEAALPTGAMVGPARAAGAAVEATAEGGRRMQRGEALIGRGQALVAQAEERMRGWPQASQVKVRTAIGRVQRAAEKLQQLRDRARATAEQARRGEGELPDVEAFMPPKREAKAAIADIKKEVRRLRKEHRKGGQDFLDYLASIDARWIEGFKSRKGLSAVERAQLDEIESASGPLGQFKLEGGGYNRRFINNEKGDRWDVVVDRLRFEGVIGENQGLEAWAEKIDAATSDPYLDAETIQREMFPDEPLDVVRAVIEDTRLDDYLDAAGNVEAQGTVSMWREHVARQLADEYAEGGAQRAQEAWLGDVERERAGFEGQPGLEALTGPERQHYEARVAAGQAGVQENIVGQRAGQAEQAALESAERARAQGQREGALVGGGRVAMEQGERELAGGARAVERAEPTVANIAELDAQAIRRVAGPVGRFYRRVGKGERAVREAAVQLARTERAIARLDAKLLRDHAKAMDSIEANPSRYRPVLAMGRQIAKNLGELADEADGDIPGSGDVYRAAVAELIVTAKDLTDAGIDPLFLIGKETPPQRSTLTGARDAGSPGAQLPIGGATGAKQKRRTGVRHGQTTEEVVKVFNQTGNRYIANKVGMAVQEKVGRTVTEILQGRGMVEDDIARMSGAQLRAAVEDSAGGTQQAFTAWDPHVAAREHGQVVSDIQIKPETVVVPVAVWNEFRNYADGRFGAEAALYDRSMRVWKGGVLALTGRWHVGNVIGNAVMATFGGDVSPVNYVRQMRNARIIMKATEARVVTPQYQKFLDNLPENIRDSLIDGRWAPPELLRRGLSASDMQKVAIPDELHRSWWKHPVERSYGVNGWVDDMNRLAVYLDKVDSGLSAVDYRAFKETHPEFANMTRQQVEREAAIKLSIRALGDFTKLRPFERKFVKRILPFYPWLRHITRLTGNLVIHDPLRVAWTLHLADAFAGDDESTIPWLRGAIPMEGDEWLRLPNINPFSDVLNTLALGDEGYQPEGLLGSISPGLSFPAAAITGMDIRNMAGIRRPVAGTDIYGRPQGEPLMTNPKELAYLLGSQFPQVQAGRELIPQLWGSQPIRRYPTGDPYVVEGTAIPANEQIIPDFVPGVGGQQMPGALAPLMPLMGIPRIENIDTAQIESRIAERKAQAETDRQRYARSREAARRNAARGVYLNQ